MTPGASTSRANSAEFGLPKAMPAPRTSPRLDSALKLPAYVLRRTRRGRGGAQSCGASAATVRDPAKVLAAKTQESHQTSYRWPGPQPSESTPGFGISDT